MSEDIQKYSQQLRQLVTDHYHQQMTIDEYRAQRKLILDEIELQFIGTNTHGEARKTAPLEADT